MNFIEALHLLKKGKKLRLKEWVNECYIILIKTMFDEEIISSRDNKKVMYKDHKKPLSLIDEMLSNDWEVYNERQSKSAKERITQDKQETKMAKLTAKKRKALPKSDFAGKDKSYPVNDKSHAANAKARATQMVKKGKLSPASKSKIDAKANKVLGKGKKKVMKKGK